MRRGRIVRAIDHNRVDFELGEEIPAASVSDVTLLLSVFKFDRMEWAIEKCTELGAARIVPVIAQREVPGRRCGKAVGPVAAIGQTSCGAITQVERAEMVHPLPLKDAIPLCAGKKIVLSEIEQDVMLKDAVAGSPDATLAFGPEGGWTEAELTQFGEIGWTSASLGGTILRARRLRLPVWRLRLR